MLGDRNDDLADKFITIPEHFIWIGRQTNLPKGLETAMGAILGEQRKVEQPQPLSAEEVYGPPRPFK